MTRIVKKGKEIKRSRFRNRPGSSGQPPIKIKDSQLYDALVVALNNPPPASPQLKALMGHKPIWDR